MRIVYTQQSISWLVKHNINAPLLTCIIFRLCSKAGVLPNLKLRVNIMPRAIHSFFDFYTNTIHIAVESISTTPRYLKLKKMLRNLLHELKHFIQYRVQRKPFKLTYSYRDAQLVNSKYWNDPDEIAARKYEKSNLIFCYRRLIKRWVRE